LPRLSAHFLCYALGRRGYGLSDDASSYAYEREYDDLVALLEHVGAPAHLLGHSSGAVCALGAALRSDRVQRLVLYEPPLPIAAALDGPWRTEAEAAAARGDLEEAALIALRGGVGFRAEQLEPLRRDPSWPRRLRHARRWIREFGEIARLPLGVEAYRGISVPTLLILGTETAPHHVHATEALHTALPEARIRRLAGQGHGAVVAAPDLFATAVIDFLSTR
jgi:pimeloyl-ACP methyl ester carboxylesterase